MKKQDSQKNQTMKNVSLNRQMIFPGKIITVICMAVIPLLVFCPSLWALDKSSLNGTFIFGEFESGFHGADINGGWGANDDVILLRTEATFDGAGNFSMTNYQYEFVRNIGEIGSPPNNQFQTTFSDNESAPDTDSGTYTVSPDGEVTMNFVGGDSDSGYLSEDGRTLVFGWSEFDDGNKYCDMGLGVGIKRGSGFNEASLDATYVFSEFESGFHGGAPGNWGANDEQYWIRTEIAFNGAGVFTLTGDEYKINRQIGETSSPYNNQFTTTYSEDLGFTDSGTYTVSFDGEVTLNFVGGDTGDAYVGEGAQTMVFGWVEFDNDNQNCCMGLGMGVKRGSGFTKASVKGTYAVGLFESDFFGGGSTYWGDTDGQGLEKNKFTFDGAGNFRAVSNEYEMERNIGEVSGGGGYSNKFTTTYSEQLNESGTGTYTVSNEGVLTLNFSDGDTGTAYLSDDGKTLVVGWSEYSNGPSDYYGSTGIGFGVKVPKVNKALPAIYLLLLGG